MDEDTMFAGYRVTKESWEEAELSEDELLDAYGGPRAIIDAVRDADEVSPLEGGRHFCAGDGERGCRVQIPIARHTCYFCTKTIRLREEHHVIR